MKKVVYKEGTFVDYAGRRRQVIFAAVSTDEIDIDVLPEKWDEPYIKIEKVLDVGVSVQYFKDEPNIELGKTIAKGKAEKEKSRLFRIYCENKGAINTKMVNALLEQELEYFQQNPGKYIASYNRHKELYEQSKIVK